MDSHESTTTSSTAECPRKPMKRRLHTRKISKDCAFEMAEARREVVYALHLHRSSSSSSSSSRGAKREENTILGNDNNNVDKPGFVVGSQVCCYSLINTLPTPDPIWSTTAPSILAAPASVEELEFEWGENDSSSWSWWLGFLKTLDKNSDSNCVEEGHSVNNIVADKTVDLKNFLEQRDDQGGSFPDEWLVVPSKDDEDDAAAP